MKRLVLMAVVALFAIPMSIAGHGSGDEIAFGGYCPVAYVEMNKAVEGKPEFASEHGGDTVYLANKKAKMMFDDAPHDYTVSYHGWCATAMSYGKKVESDPTVFLVRDGRTYLFSNEKAKKTFVKDPAGMTVKADKSWAEIGSGHTH